MSIWDVIGAWVADGRLVVLQPEFEVDGGGRFIIATAELECELYGAVSDADRQERYGRARALLDAFVSNLRIIARQPPSKSVRAQLALLEERSDEVWEFRTQKPGIRIFGRFADYNVFIALNVELRERIDDDFLREKEECKQKWRLYFPYYEPHRGAALSDYFSNFDEV